MKNEITVEDLERVQASLGRLKGSLSNLVGTVSAVQIDLAGLIEKRRNQ